MKVNRQILEEQLADYEDQSKRLHSYLHELKATTTKHGTQEEHFRDDLMEAENDVLYYEREIARIKKELAQAPQTVEGAPRQGLGSLVFSSISFVVGAVLGSRIKSRKDKM